MEDKILLSDKWNVDLERYAYHWLFWFGCVWCWPCCVQICVSQLLSCTLVTYVWNWWRTILNVWFVVRWSCVDDKMVKSKNWLTFNLEVAHISHAGQFKKTLKKTPTLPHISWNNKKIQNSNHHSETLLVTALIITTITEQKYKQQKIKWNNNHNNNNKNLQ